MEQGQLTVDATPPGDVAGLVMGEEEAVSGKTRSHDGVRKLNRGL